MKNYIKGLILASLGAVMISSAFGIAIGFSAALIVTGVFMILFGIVVGNKIDI